MSTIDRQKLHDEWPMWSPANLEAQWKELNEKQNREARKKHLADIEFVNQNERGK
jgi:hypothetical protein